MSTMKHFVIDRSTSIYQSWMWILCIVNMVFLLKTTSQVSNWKAPNLDLMRMLGRVHALIFNWSLVKFMYELDC